MTEETILTEDEVRALYGSGDAAHDFDHVLRVAALAQAIAAAEGADAVVVRLAALLHDVPVAARDATVATAGRADHHRDAARFAGDLLRARGLGTARIDNVVHAIEAHRFRDRSIQPQTLEAMCLYDADKLDSMGAIGVARCFAYAGAQANRLWTESHRAVSLHAGRPRGREYTPVHEYVYKLSQLYGTLHTETGRRLGMERHQFMRAFFTQLDVEMLGAA